MVGGRGGLGGKLVKDGDALGMGRGGVPEGKMCASASARQEERSH